MNPKAIGGVLLLVGTSIGAGMLALPIALARVGLPYSILLAVLCWLVMYMGARFMLEVNLAFAPGSHLVSMAKARLGWRGEFLAWVSCLCLLYSLLSGYIAGGSDVSKAVALQLGFHVSSTLATVSFTLILGAIVYTGIRFVDYFNRLLMFGKLAVFGLVVFALFPHVNPAQYAFGEFSAIPSCLMILVTSFGFASIVPSLRTYFSGEEALLRQVILYGSLIPLICYFIWLAVIMGILPTKGPQSLNAMSQSSQPLGLLIKGLQQGVGTGWIEQSFTAFTIICLFTAFLGVALGLFDFIADGFQLNKRGPQGAMVFALTFFPPMLLVIFYPGIYLLALTYAGRCCVLLLLCLPCWMLWKSDAQMQWRAARGKLGIIFVFLVAILLLYIGG